MGNGTENMYACDGLRGRLQGMLLTYCTMKRRSNLLSISGFQLVESVWNNFRQAPFQQQEQPSFHPFTFSLSHLFTLSPFHLFTLFTFSSFHPFTFSPFHFFTLSSFHLFTLSPFHPFIFSSFHLFTFSPFHLFTLSPFHSLTFSSFHLFTSSSPNSRSSSWVRVSKSGVAVSVRWGGAGAARVGSNTSCWCPCSVVWMCFSRT